MCDKKKKVPYIAEAWLWPFLDTLFCPQPALADVICDQTSFEVDLKKIKVNLTLPHKTGNNILWPHMNTLLLKIH